MCHGSYFGKVGWPQWVNINKSKLYLNYGYW